MLGSERILTKWSIFELDVFMKDVAKAPVAGHICESVPLSYRYPGTSFKAISYKV